MAESSTTTVPALRIESVGSIDDISEADWDALSGTDNPFLRHAFFAALERSGCTTRQTGWIPAHLKLIQGGELVGLIPAFRKLHSMGEYVFDWAWADAYERYGMDYYPKLLMAVPFTPSQGARLLLKPEFRERLRPEDLHAALDQVAEALSCHSWHLLFPNARDQSLLDLDGRLHRIGCQFHWFNRDYQSFDDFLATLTSRKRKSIRKERRQVSEQGIEFRHFPAHELPDHVLDAFYVFYQATYLKRGQRPYLKRGFFQALKENQPEQMHVVMAVKDGEMIAGALFLLGQDTLYGRYWGCLEDYQHLHFETCYYQGIELAIDKGFRCFDAGAQGEHKLVRGFEPQLTHSWHWVAHPGFAEAIEQFTLDEAEDVIDYRDAALEALPYRQEE
ncbi:GNAT family N-acetyltransferase [Marinobacter nanhaiticus D15-8W]|uniref:N-acetyltransferase n=1 Tax=Marinobacter nanhaiticus D15-8W TaxID=626887 RepID=N6VSH0_9GAMM|nr:GNAT family N-acetyltransferase [Marinobacter nanhaiticus]ENO13110.1 N-acetyltransferase [Marinobacter nanhaiticus D15-8W]BES70467.1 GNAT family N-acetyltransferase [Marinobacter nanhaiticus D15-8W]